MRYNDIEAGQILRLTDETPNKNWRNTRVKVIRTDGRTVRIRTIGNGNLSGSLDYDDPSADFPFVVLDVAEIEEDPLP